MILSRHWVHQESGGQCESLCLHDFDGIDFFFICWTQNTEYNGERSETERLSNVWLCQFEASTFSFCVCTITSSFVWHACRHLLNSLRSLPQKYEQEVWRGRRGVRAYACHSHRARRLFVDLVVIIFLRCYAKLNFHWFTRHHGWTFVRRDHTQTPRVASIFAPTLHQHRAQTSNTSPAGKPKLCHGAVHERQHPCTECCRYREYAWALKKHRENVRFKSKRRFEMGEPILGNWGSYEELWVYPWRLRSVQ